MNVTIFVTEKAPIRIPTSVVPLRGCSARAEGEWMVLDVIRHRRFAQANRTDEHLGAVTAAEEESGDLAKEAEPDV